MRRRRSEAGGVVSKGPGALPEYGTERREAATPGGFAVGFVRRESARRMLDIGPMNPVWIPTTPVSIAPGVGMLGRSSGALVRVRPPADAPAERVEQLRALLVERGAAAVKILPPAAGPVMAPQTVEATPARGIREVVVACAARTRSKDRAALDAVLDGALSEEGI